VTIRIGSKWVIVFFWYPLKRIVLDKEPLNDCCCCLANDWQARLAECAKKNCAALLFAVKPRFPRDHITEVYIWAGKTRNITCHIHAEPLPAIEWLHHGRALVNNETYRIYKMSKDSNLQVIHRVFRPKCHKIAVCLPPWSRWSFFVLFSWILGFSLKLPIIVVKPCFWIIVKFALEHGRVD